MGKFSKRLRAAFGRSDKAKSPATKVTEAQGESQSYTTHFAYVVARLKRADAIMDVAVSAIGTGDLETQQRALEQVATLSVEAAEHAVAATKLVREERKRQIDQPEGASA